MKGVKFLSLFLPLMLAYFLEGNPIASYMTAWIGSFLLFYLSLTGFIAPLPNDLPFAQQMMRPIIIIQLIFCGFNFCSSIFHFLNALGMEDFKWRPNYYVDMIRIDKIAGAQRYYLLGHISLLLGMYSRSLDKVKLKYKIREDINLNNFLVGLTFCAFVGSIVMRFVPGLSQVGEQCSNLSFLSGTYAICYSIIRKDRNLILLSGLFYVYNFIALMSSGFKEPIIVSFILVMVFMYPYYKKIVIISALPILYICFFIVPTYVSIFRGLAQEGGTIEEIRDKALTAALDSKESNWDFLVGRLSEIGMFTKYIETTPSIIPYYDTKIVQQALIVLVPRIAWPDKPITEELVMKRVYDAGVVNNMERVSAKPMYIVDSYLSAGPFGIMLSLFLYGFALQSIAGIAESWFGGYFLGTAIIFNGLFPIFWRGLSFEFILNVVAYSFLTMYVIRWLLHTYNFLDKIYDDSPDSAIL